MQVAPNICLLLISTSCVVAALCNQSIQTQGQCFQSVVSNRQREPGWSVAQGGSRKRQAAWGQEVAFTDKGAGLEQQETGTATEEDLALMCRQKIRKVLIRPPDHWKSSLARSHCSQPGISQGSHAGFSNQSPRQLFFFQLPLKMDIVKIVKSHPPIRIRPPCTLIVCARVFCQHHEKQLCPCFCINNLLTMSAGG